MNRNQIIVVVSCALLCVGLYLFTDIKKPKQENAPVAAMPQEQIEILDMEKYITEVNAAITDSAIKESAGQLAKSNSYSELGELYYKMDKPLAVVYYMTKQAEADNSASSYLQAGDYGSMLIQTAPDEKARNFLGANIIRCYEKAVALDSSSIDNKLRLAGAYLENSGQPMQGVSILMNIIDRDSNHIGALLMLGRFGIVSGQFDKAIARLEKVLYLRPQNSEALLLMAEAYNSKGDKNRAIEYLERCQKSVSNPELKKEIENHIESIKKPNG